MHKEKMSLLQKKFRKLEEKYKDDDVVILSSDENINFSINKKTNKVVVTHSIKDELMNIEDRSDIVRYYFYDGETAINKFDIYYRQEEKAILLSTMKRITVKVFFIMTPELNMYI